jgi:hypothetical protein
VTGLTLSDKTFSYAEGAVSALFAAQAAPIK